MIAVVTDSASQLPASLAARLHATVVPVTVTIDGVDHLEGVDLTAEAFYERVDGASNPLAISTDQPSASAFVSAFEDRIAEGATELLVVLVGSAYSGAVNSAEVAVGAIERRHPDVTITVVDSGTASFGISCAVWAAADVVAAGGSLGEAAQAARHRAGVTGSVFMLDGTEVAQRSGRFDSVDLGAAVPVLASGPDGLSVLGEVTTLHEGVDLMVAALVARAPRVVAAVGRASASTDSVTDVLRERLIAHDRVAEVVDYRVGPSIAAHTGPHTVGGFSFPA